MRTIIFTVTSQQNATRGGSNPSRTPDDEWPDDCRYKQI